MSLGQRNCSKRGAGKKKDLTQGLERVLATAAILKFIKMDNDQLLWPIMVVQEETYRPIMVGLQYFFQLNTAWGEVMAYLCVITVPVLIFYLRLQKAFIASIASTGIKG